MLVVIIKLKSFATMFRCLSLCEIGIGNGVTVTTINIWWSFCLFQFPYAWFSFSLGVPLRFRSTIVGWRKEGIHTEVNQHPTNAFSFVVANEGGSTKCTMPNDHPTLCNRLLTRANFWYVILCAAKRKSEIRRTRKGLTLYQHPFWNWCWVPMNGYLSCWVMKEPWLNIRN